MDLCDPVLEGRSLNVIFHVAILESSFEGNELPFLEGLGELREIPPGIDAVPFGAGLVFALVVLPALLGCDVEDDELTVVLSGFGFCILTESADEGDFVEHGVGLRFFWLCPLSAVHACPEGVPSPSSSRGEWTESVEGDPNLLWGRSPHLTEARSGFREGERASEGRGCTWRGTLNARQKGKPEGSLPVQWISHGTRLQKADQNNGVVLRTQRKNEKGIDRTEALPHGPISRLCHGSPNVGSSC